jgi:hypothetical protein
LLADLAGRCRLPSIAEASNFAEEGGLMDNAIDFPRFTMHGNPSRLAAS